MKDFFRLGVSGSDTFFSNEKAFYDFGKAGIKAIEYAIVLPTNPFPDFAAVKKNAESNGMTVNSVHLPFYPFETNNPASLDEGIRKATVKMQSGYINAMGEAGIHIAVIHASGEPNPDELRTAMTDSAKRSLCELAEIGSKVGVTVAVEDLPRTCIGNTAENILELISEDDRLRVCFDTNHILRGTNADFINKVGKKIITTHVSDYDFADEKHWLPLTGSNDWNAIIDGLYNIGYSGPFLYEVGMRDDVNDRYHPHIPEDYKINYEELIKRYNAK